MTTSARVVLATLFSLVYWAAAVSMAGDEAGVDAKVAFERLKTLKGEWKSSEKDDHHGSAKVIYAVTAAGSALMETQHVGSEHEMVTMYHLDGDELRVTHYCAAGNQPRLKLDRKGSTANLYSFVFDGGSNLDVSKDLHIHSFKVRFLEGGKIESEWEAYMEGKSTGTTKFPMSRL